MGWGAEPPGPSKEGTNSKYCRTHEAHKLDLYLKVITDLKRRHHPHIITTRDQYACLSLSHLGDCNHCRLDKIHANFENVKLFDSPHMILC